MRILRQAVVACALAGVFATLPALRGDDIYLTDGRKISGTVVGMEKGSFKVETDFGIALIRKEKVARIEVSKPAPPPEKPADKPSTTPPPTPTPPATLQSGSTSGPTSAAPPPPQRTGKIQERKPPGGHIEDHVDGITYFNDSFGFQMYKPPNWKLLPEVAASIPNSVAAMGTEKEDTLVIVGSVLFDGPASTYAAMLGAGLGKIYEEFESQPAETIEIDGKPAIRRTFSGKANNRVWHGMIANFADNRVHYGIIGVTSEENFQFKTTVLNKILSSFHSK